MKTTMNKSGAFRLGFIFTVLFLPVGISCSNKTSTPDDEVIATLQADNARLTNENEALKKEVKELEETPDFVFREGIDLLNQNELEQAKGKFEEVVDKYPYSPYEKTAKDKIKEVDRELVRIEAEKKKAEKEAEEAKKYEVKTPEEAAAEWVAIRNNPEASKGKVVTWRVKVTDCTVSFFEGTLGGDKGVIVDTTARDEDEERYLKYKYIVPSMHEGDWVVVTGEVSSVTKEVCLKPVKVINEGYSDSR